MNVVMKRQRVPCWLACVYAFFSICQVSYGLDPNHQLTQYLHRVWQAQEGLPGTSITFIRQTSDGYLWVGTQDGVVRFDGVRFTPLMELVNAGLGDFWARQMVEDGDGVKWLLGPDQRLVRVDSNGAHTISAEDGMTAEFSCIANEKGGGILACTADGLVRIRGNQKQVFHAREPFLWHPTAACEAGGGNVWLVAGSTVWTWNGETFSPYKTTPELNGSTFRAIVCDGDGIWVGSSKGVLHIRGNRERLYTQKDGLASTVVLSLTRGVHDTLWIGTRNGFSRLANGIIENFSYEDGLSQKIVFAIREDREGSLWVGTGHGLNQFVDGAAVRYTKREGLPSDNVGPLLEDRQGRLWAGTLDAGLARFDGRRFRAVPALTMRHVAALAEGSNGTLWVATDSGVARIQDGQATTLYSVASGLPADNVRAVFVDHKGNLWAGTEKGPAILKDSAFVQPPQLSTLRWPVVAVGQAADGDMLFALERAGIWSFDGEKVHKLDDREQLPFDDINAIFTDASGTTWIGSNGSGLGMIHNGNFKRFPLRDGVPDSEIYGFASDGKGRLWLAGSKGFYSIDAEVLQALRNGTTSRLKTVAYWQQEGLRTLQGTPNVSPVGGATRDGKVWFSTGRGLIAFEADLGARNIKVPVAISSVTVNGVDQDSRTLHELPPGSNNLEIDYTALTYLASQRIQFRYLLEGFDRNWIQAGARREAFYTNLPPGPYRFRVMACSDSFPCNEAVEPLAFEVLPHFYQRGRFAVLVALAIAGIIFAAYRLRMNKLKTQFALVLAERNRIARELHDTLIQGYSGITMQLQALTGRMHSEDDRQMLHEIILEAGQCLQDTRRSVAGLRAGVGSSAGLSQAIAIAARQAADPQQDVRLALKLEDRHQELPAEVKYNLVCIAQEAVTNAVKHSGAQDISVDLDCSGAELKLIIEDNGCGIAKNGMSSNGHYGMIGMRERAAQIGAQLKITSVPAKGTKVFLRLPLPKDARTGSAEARLKPIS